jgi:hypothetical protein
MPGRLSAVTPVKPGRLLRPVALVVGLLVLAGGLAALGGWLWWRWWSPAPTGQIYERQDHTYGWYATPLDPGQAHVASATFEYVVVGFLLALLVGLAAALLGRNRPLTALAVTLVAGALGAYLTWQVGLWFSPPDPSRLADKAHFGQLVDGKPKLYPGSLSVAGWTPFLAWPVGSLLGFLGIMLSISGERSLDPAYAAEPVVASPGPVEGQPIR